MCNSYNFSANRQTPHHIVSFTKGVKYVRGTPAKRYIPSRWGTSPYLKIWRTSSSPPDTVWVRLCGHPLDMWAGSRWAAQWRSREAAARWGRWEAQIQVSAEEGRCRYGWAGGQRCTARWRQAGVHANEGREEEVKGGWYLGPTLTATNGSKTVHPSSRSPSLLPNAEQGRPHPLNQAHRWDHPNPENKNGTVSSCPTLSPDQTLPIFWHIQDIDALSSELLLQYA